MFPLVGRELSENNNFQAKLPYLIWELGEDGGAETTINTQIFLCSIRGVLPNLKHRGYLISLWPSVQGSG